MKMFYYYDFVGSKYMLHNGKLQQVELESFEYFTDTEILKIKYSLPSGEIVELETKDERPITPIYDDWNSFTRNNTSKISLFNLEDVAGYTATINHDKNMLAQVVLDDLGHTSFFEDGKIVTINFEDEVDKIAYDKETKGFTYISKRVQGKQLFASRNLAIGYNSIDVVDKTGKTRAEGGRLKRIMPNEKQAELIQSLKDTFKKLKEENTLILFEPDSEGLYFFNGNEATSIFNSEVNTHGAPLLMDRFSMDSRTLPSQQIKFKGLIDYAVEETSLYLKEHIEKGKSK